MVLIHRITRLFRADMHAILDRMEEPEILLKQAVREMEDVIGDDEKRLKLLNHEQEQLGKKYADSEQLLKEIEEELDVCFAAGNDTLARGQVKRKLENEKRLKNIQRRRENLEKTVTELQGQLATQRGHLQAMQQKLALLSEQETAGFQGDGTMSAEMMVDDDEVEVALLRERQKRNVS